jgi:3-hydroxymyristoyl/3-hydroxydecanoyl-(acyl carrier protein) dehydratase
MKFRMVDRIIAWQSRQSIVGVKAISFEEYELRRRLGDEPCLPESLIMESLFQLGNWLLVLSSDFQQMGLVVRFEEVRFVGRLRPGRRLRMQARVRTWRDDGVVFDGSGSADGEEIVTGRGCLAAPVPLADYADPADLRVLFSEIHRPDASKDQGLWTKDYGLWTMD